MTEEGGSGGRRAGRLIGIAVVALLIVTGAAYVPAVLLAPLPAASAVEVPAASADAPRTPPTLPADASTALTLAADAEPVIGGDEGARPMAGITKLVTALVVLDAHPLAAGRAGPPIDATRRDVDAATVYDALGLRTVPVLEGETWTQRDVVQTMLRASSNNHADMLAVWAFGSLEGYRTAATAWLERSGLTGTAVVDATGVEATDVTTARDAARLGALALAEPSITGAFRDEALTVNGRAIPNVVARDAPEGWTILSASYTDASGVCILFAADVPTDEGATAVVGAVLGEPGWARADADLAALAETLPGSLGTGASIEDGEVVATYTTAWGATADAVAADAVTSSGWLGDAPGRTAVDLRRVSTAEAGTRVGTATVGEKTVPVALDSALPAPDVLWRLTHPHDLLPGLVAQVRALF